MSGNDFFDRRYSQGIPDQRPGFFSGLLIALFFSASVIAWIYAVRVNTPASRSVIHITLAVAALYLAYNLFMIFRVGYNGFGMNFFVNYVLALIFSVAGMFIFDVRVPVGSAQTGQTVWHFVLYLVTACLMSGLPTFVISGITWLLMAMFGDM